MEDVSIMDLELATSRRMTINAAAKFKYRRKVRRRNAGRAADILTDAIGKFGF
jgi:hypothetical protein